jgi:protein disulfide-isomerase-like protein
LKQKAEFIMMKIACLSVLLSLANTASAIELTPDNYEAETDGKTVFIKFFAPWCGHCKKMKPDWDKLMGEFEGSATQLIADVDCTADGKSLCDANGVKGFPTLKWGDPTDLQDYQGGRDFDSLKEFATNNLKPVCSVKNIDLCDDDKKAEIKKFQDMSADDLKAAIAAEEKKLEDAESNFKAEVQKLQDTYTKLMADKEKTISDVKAGGLGLMKSVAAAAGKDAKDEL